jgi:hypothetical protein
VKRPASLAAGVAAAAVASLALALAALAQPAGNQPAEGAPGPEPSTAPPPGVPVIEPPPEVAPPPGNATNAPEAGDEGEKAATNSAAAKPPPPPPAAPPKPVRSPAAVLQALDKVTAETMRFAAPLGQPVRYKNLVFTVRTCETTGLGTASPQASAYVVVDFAPLGAEGIAPTPPRQVFKGWMFANSPGLNPLQHPSYDAWLVTCIAASPPA